jgi:hypothetical protein
MTQGKSYWDDPYLRLKEWPTPPDEICACPPGAPIKLMSALGANPIHCLRCNLEVPPERLALAGREVDAVADWRLTYNAIGALELASGEYEQWARDQLLDLNSPPNIDGRKLAAMLSEKECYFWVWQPEADDESVPLTECPYCGDALAPYDEGIFPQMLCERDSIVVVGGWGTSSA